ncbi:MAG: NAD(P)H-dependent oxidoreductase [Candidatus Bipolaricaulis sp.]|nr:NAD(P)H-dependent oxidoreductase [Candidatus Bipolaricaulis sp.]MDD5645962.1 NAD(P)H-dependent oxidoreductase [Candidatus Bipolaricaulis sp.]
MTQRKALLLVGSPRGIGHSTSDRLGSVVLDALKGRSFDTEKLHVHAVMDSPAAFESALAAIGACDTVILSLPLYVDSFPAPVIALLERIAERRVGAGRVRFSLVIQCGFPEAKHNATALAIAERFASEVGWEWLGGAALGGTGGFAKDVGAVLAPVGEAIADGKTVPEVASSVPFPAWLYRFVGNVMWRRQAKKQGATRSLRARPYEG